MFEERREKPIESVNFTYDYRLRLLLTSECFFKCTYCHNEGQNEHYQETLDAEDYAFLYTAFHQEFGSNRVALSGGEPLSRPDIVEIARELHSLGARSTLITNGVLLGTPRQPIDYLAKLHVSLDTMERNIFRELCGSDTFSLVVANIKKARAQRPNLPIKVNTVLIDGVNNDPKSINNLVDFASDHNATNSFIEKMTPKSDPEFIDIDEFEDFLEDMGFEFTSKTPLKTTFGYRDRKRQIELFRCFCPTAGKTGNPAYFCNKNNNTFFINPDGRVNSCMVETKLTNIADLIKGRYLDQLKAKLRLIMELMGNNCPLSLLCLPTRQLQN